MPNDSLADTNVEFVRLLKEKKYDELIENNIELHIDESDSAKDLIKYLFSDENILYYLYREGYSFDEVTKNQISNFIIKNHIDDENVFRIFISGFFTTKEELEALISDNRELFKRYIENNQNNCLYGLFKFESFIDILLKEKYVNLIKRVDEYSLNNLKKLAPLIDDGLQLSYNEGSDRLAIFLFENQEQFTSNEFCKLLTILLEKKIYDREEKGVSNFELLIENNVEDLVLKVTETGITPKCLIESKIFRDYCIKNNRFDLAIKCVVPNDLFQNDELMDKYCSELKIDKQELYKRGKWILLYYEKNNNIFNTILGTSLSDNMFKIKKEHYERFINDVELQMQISKLNDKEILFLGRTLENMDYRDYEISSLISSIIVNINHYRELIDSMDINNITNEEIIEIVKVIQLPNNEFQIKNIESLQDYNQRKVDSLNLSIENNDLIKSKDKLLKYLFNISVNEAKYIDYKYCHNNDDEEVLDRLANSELPKEIYYYLYIINMIIKCKDVSSLKEIYNQYHDQLYDEVIPFEVFLRAQYSKLYSDSLYKIDERNQVYGPKDSYFEQAEFHDNTIKVCIPRENFRFFVHCVGSCSLASEVIDKNYKNDWMDRQQLQNHFVACSYVNERGIYSIRSEGSIILGFDNLKGGSICGMGNADIDSIGPYANSYAGSRKLQECNGSRARYFVPSEILQTINNRYNEIVVERRSTKKNEDYPIKRKPDYIIMMAESSDPINFNYLDSIYQNQLSFISDEDRNIIAGIGNSRELKQFLIKYKDIIKRFAEINGIKLNDLANQYVESIMKAKYYEDCLKAASEFDIPLIIVDKKYYFNRMLYASDSLSEEQKEIISSAFDRGNYDLKKKLFNGLAKGQDILQMLQPNTEKISITI